AEDGLLAGDAGDGGDADVEALAGGGADGEAAVLGKAALGDVHARKDFQARDQRWMFVTAERLRVIHDAVDAHADDGAGGTGLDVDIGRGLLDGLLDNLVEEGDGGRLFAHVRAQHELLNILQARILLVELRRGRLRGRTGQERVRRFGEARLRA